MSKTYILLAITGFTIALSLGIFINKEKISQKPAETSEATPTSLSKINQNSSPFGDYERLTIPYLQQQTYPGSPITIESKIDEFNAYTSYLVSYQSEGLTINGLLTKPTTPEPPEGYPAVVFIHGYIPPKQYDTTARYQGYVDYLAKKGLVVFKIDLRGHGTSEGEPNGAYYSSDYIIDTINAYESLKTLDYVNKKNIGLWGHSMAGNVVLRSLAAKPEISKAVIWAGAVYTYQDMQDYRIQDNSYQPNQNPNRNRRQILFDAVGPVTSDNPFWQIVAATNYIETMDGKLQIHHAVNDAVVSIEYSRNLKRIFDTNHISVKLFEYESGGHNLEGSSFNQAMARTAAFLTDY